MLLILKNGVELEIQSEVAIGNITLVKCNMERLHVIVGYLSGENSTQYKIKDGAEIVRFRTEQKMSYTVTPIKENGDYLYTVNVVFNDMSDIDRIIERIDLNDEQITELQEAIVEVGL